MEINPTTTKPKVFSRETGNWKSVFLLKNDDKLWIVHYTCIMHISSCKLFSNTLRKIFFFFYELLKNCTTTNKIYLKSRISFGDNALSKRDSSMLENEKKFNL